MKNVAIKIGEEKDVVCFLGKNGFILHSGNSYGHCFKKIGLIFYFLKEKPEFPGLRLKRWCFLIKYSFSHFIEKKVRFLKQAIQSCKITGKIFWFLFWDFSQKKNNEKNGLKEKLAVKKKISPNYSMGLIGSKMCFGRKSHKKSWNYKKLKVLYRRLK